MLSAAASLGTILLWDVDGGLTQIDKYLYSSEDYIKVGGTDPSAGSVAVWGTGWRGVTVDFALVCCVTQLLSGERSDALCPRFLSSSQQGGGALGDCLRHLWGPLVTEL